MVRVPVAIALMGIGGVVAYDRVVSTVGFNGTLTGPVLPITAPIDGRVADPNLEIGAFVDGGAPLLHVSNATVDRQVLERLAHQRAATAAALAGAEARIEVLEAMRGRLAHSLGEHLAIAAETLRLKVHEADAAVAAAVARLRQAEDELERFNRRSKDFVTAARQAEIRAAVDVAAADVRVAEARRDRVTAELDAAERGIYSNDGFFETPYPAQRADEVELRLIEERARAVQLEAELAHLTELAAREERRTDALTERTLESPSSGMVWSASVGPGSDVRAGQVLAEIASCADLFVEVPLSEARVGDVRVGMDVVVDFTGAREPVPGTVRSLKGAGATLGRDGRAAHVSDLSRGMMIVAVSVDGAALARSLGEGCHIGRTAQVRFGTASGLPDAEAVASSVVWSARAIGSVIQWALDTSKAAAAALDPNGPAPNAPAPSTTADG